MGERDRGKFRGHHGQLTKVGIPRALPGLICATGHGMLGMQVAPPTGQLVADLASGKPTRHPIDALSPDRLRGIVVGKGEREGDRNEASRARDGEADV